MGRCRRNGEHREEDLAKSGYKSNMKYKYWIILLYIGYTLKTKHKNLRIFFSSLFVIENLQNRLIFEYFKFSFVVKFRQ
jgi:hypothetical protein